MKLHEFFRAFENTPYQKRFELIEFAPEPSSLFVIFQRLNRVKAQKKYYEEQEAHLLIQAEVVFERLNKR
jgi:hypothetical protein